MRLSTIRHSSYMRLTSGRFVFDEPLEGNVKAGMTRRRSIEVLAVGVIVLLASACGSLSASVSPDRGYIKGLGVVEQVKLHDRVRLPQIAGETLEGGSFNSRDYLGKVLVINVWGSWCAPCRAEAPVLRRVSAESAAEGVQFVGIDVRDNNAAAIAFERRYKITYPSITTADSGQAMLAFGSMLPRNAVPSTLVVDRNGKVAARVVGRTTYSTLHSLVGLALAEPTGSPSDAKSP